MSNKPRVLVLTLYSGENEIEACKQSVSHQTGVDVSHEIFEHLPNIEAHRQLYARIMDQSKNYDWFVKLDADMVLNHDTTLIASIKDINARNDNTGMAIFTVSDWPTDMPIWGINFFSPSCHWDWVEKSANIPDDLFVDPDPEYNGARLIIDDAPAPIASHMADPSEWQAFFFGFHRAMKALSMDGNKPSPRSKTQWRILCSVGAHYRQNQDRRLALIIAGAQYARDLERMGNLPHTLNKDDENLKIHFTAIQKSINTELDKTIGGFWTNASKAMRHWYFARGGWKLMLDKILKRG